MHRWAGLATYIKTNGPAVFTIRHSSRRRNTPLLSAPCTGAALLKRRCQVFSKFTLKELGLRGGLAGLGGGEHGTRFVPLNVGRVEGTTMTAEFFRNLLLLESCIEVEGVSWLKVVGDGFFVRTIHPVVKKAVYNYKPPFTWVVVARLV